MNWLSIVNNKLGLNKYNSFELNYGKRGDTNAKLIKLLGPENIDRLGIEQDCLLLRLLVNMPMATVKILGTKMVESYSHVPVACGLEQCTRSPGFASTGATDMPRPGNSVLTHWRAGDVWNIPWGVPHASTNFGYKVKYTVSLTGKLRA